MYDSCLIFNQHAGGVDEVGHLSGGGGLKSRAEHASIGARRECGACLNAASEQNRTGFLVTTTHSLTRASRRYPTSNKAPTIYFIYPL